MIFKSERSKFLFSRDSRNNDLPIHIRNKSAADDDSEEEYNKDDQAESDGDNEGGKGNVAAEKSFSKLLKLKQKVMQVEEEFNIDTIEKLIEVSNKLVFIIEKVKYLKSRNQRVLIFSKSKAFLDIIEDMVTIIC